MTSADPLTETLAFSVRAARVKANLSQRELAAKLGVASRSLQEWEAGRSVPQPRNRRALAAFLANGAAAEAGDTTLDVRQWGGNVESLVTPASGARREENA